MFFAEVFNPLKKGGNMEPALHCGSNEEGARAAALLDAAGISYVDMGPIEDVTIPYVKYGPWKFRGIKEIERFVERWKAGQQPQMNL